MTAQPLGRAQRAALAHLVDQGPVESAEGFATTVLAQACAMRTNHCSQLLGTMARAGLVERVTDIRHTYRIDITDAGREALSRCATWARTPRRRPTGPPPAMPDLGPIGHLPVVAARDAACEYAFSPTF